jgi:hypothetical protein
VKPAPPPAGAAGGAVAEVISGADGSLLELVDHLLNQGVVLTGEIVLGLADVDLIYLRLSVLLCAADKVLGEPPGAPQRPRRRSG